MASRSCSLGGLRYKDLIAGGRAELRTVKSETFAIGLKIA
jgi:hypothetical protein